MDIVYKQDILTARKQDSLSRKEVMSHTQSFNTKHGSSSNSDNSPGDSKASHREYGWIPRGRVPTSRKLHSKFLREDLLD